MREIPEGSAPLIRRDISYDTLEACVLCMPNGKSSGCDCIPRGFYKYGLIILLEHLHFASFYVERNDNFLRSLST